MSVFFNGQLLVTPTTASAVNDDAMLNQNLSVGNSIAYIGLSQGGKPFEVLAFGSPEQARNTLLGGELCTAVTNAFAPSTETGAPQTVYAVRLSKHKVAQYVLKTPSSNEVFGTIRGLTYSPDDLLTRIKIENGTHAAAGVSSTDGTNPATGDWSPRPVHHFTISAEVSRNGVKQLIKGVDINKSPVQIEFLQDDSQITVLQSGNEMIVVVDDRDYQVRQEIHIDYSAFPTLGAVLEILRPLVNGKGDPVFAITVDNDDALNYAPNIFDEGIYGSKGKHELSCNGWAFKNWFETKLNGLVDFELNETIWSSYWQGLTLKDWTYLQIPQPTQAEILADPDILTVTPADWNKALDLLSTRDIQWVQAVTGDGAIQAAVNSHCIHCSSVTGKRERRTILGTKSGTSDVDAIKQAKAINSPRASLVHIGHYAYDDKGKLVLRPPYMTAGLVAAAFAGMNPGNAMTNKTIAVQGLERELRNPTDTDALILGGVMPIENTETGYKVTQSITTWLGNSKYNLREQSCGVAVDFTIRNVRLALEPLRGAKQSPLLLSRAISITKGALMELARPEPQGPEVLVGDENYPAWRNVTATVEGDVLRVQFEASPAIPNNYILVTMYAVPYSGSATA